MLAEVCIAYCAQKSNDNDPIVIQLLFKAKDISSSYG